MEVGQAAQPEQMTDEKSQRFAQGASGGGAPTVCAGGEGAIPPEMYDLAHAQWEDIRRRRAPDLPELAELLTILQDRYPEEPERREKTLKVLAGSKGDEKNAVARARALLRGKHQEGG